MADRIEDSGWIRQAFRLSGRSITDSDKRRRSYSSAGAKYTDTSLGGNYAINNPHQFTHLADPVHKSQYSPSFGMGRYYSEAIDDNSVKVHMRFGVPEYNGLTTFFANMYNPEAGSMARTGESVGLIFSVAKLAGFVVSLPLVPFVMVGRFYRFMADKPYSKYYYLKPTMALYWNAVNTIVNMIATNMGLTAIVDNENFEFVQATDKNGDPIKGQKVARPKANAGLSSSDITAFNRTMPDIFQADGGIDIFSVATRAQRISNKDYQARNEAIENLQTRADLNAYANQHQQANVNYATTNPSLSDMLDRHLQSDVSNPPESNDKQDEIGTWEGPGFIEHFKANLNDALEWVTFRVNNEENASESFSSSTKTIDLAEKLNSMSSSARNARTSMADGNIGNDPISGALELILGGAKDVVSGFAAGFGLNGLAILGGAAFTDIPEQFDRASYNAPTTSYTMELRTPYGNKMSIFTNLYVPLAMLLAAALPISTGKQSYTSPFLLELYSKGRTQIRLGIIDSLQIKRGVGNVGWSNDHLPLGIDITFSVKDLSTVMHMPLNDSHGIFDDDSTFTDYMAVLGSMGLTEQIYAMDRLKNNMSHFVESFDKYTSPAYHANWVAGTMPGRVLSALARSSGRS